jgi:hypothetical protein
MSPEYLSDRLPSVGSESPSTDQRKRYCFGSQIDSPRSSDIVQHQIRLSSTTGIPAYANRRWTLAGSLELAGLMLKITLGPLSEVPWRIFL